MGPTAPSPLASGPRACPTSSPTRWSTWRVSTRAPASATPRWPCWNRRWRRASRPGDGCRATTIWLRCGTRRVSSSCSTGC